MPEANTFLINADERATYRAGIDLGGTKIEIIVLKQGQVCFRHRIPLPVHTTQQQGYKSSMDAMAGLIEQAIEHLQVSAEDISVGIGTPGTVNDAGLMKNANSVYLNGMPFQEDIQLRLQRPIRISNDANCFTLSEAVDGVAMGVASVFGVILGTGCGGGLVIGGMVQRGVNSIAGEWGHNPLPFPDHELNECEGRMCYCGRRGCIETWISGPGLSHDFLACSGNTKSANEIAIMAGDGDDDAVQALERYERRLAKSLATVINVFDPEVIVLGGGLSNIARLYENVPKIWGEYVFSDSVKTKLLAPKYGDSSGVRGAAWLWDSHNTR